MSNQSGVFKPFDVAGARRHRADAAAAEAPGLNALLLIVVVIIAMLIAVSRPRVRAACFACQRHHFLLVSLIE
jgi:hypothetical protein